MKRLLTIGLLTVGLAAASYAQPVPEIINTGQYSSLTNGPQIDCTAFVNNAPFALFDPSVLGLTYTINGFGVPVYFPMFVPPFEFSDTQYYTNNSTMAVNSGFQFDTEPSQTGYPHPAVDFVNNSGSTIYVNSATNVGVAGEFIVGGIDNISQPPELIVSATNIFQHGLMDAGVNSLISLGGNNLDLSSGIIHLETGQDDQSLFSDGPSVLSYLTNGAQFVVSPPGVADYWWGTSGFPVANNNNGAVINFPSFNSTVHLVTNNIYVTNAVEIPTSITPLGGTVYAFANEQTVNAQTNSVQVVLIENANPAVSVQCAFESGTANFSIPVIQFQSAAPGLGGAPTVTNSIYVADTLGILTKFYTFTNNTLSSVLPTFPPDNYFVSLSFPGYSSLPQGGNTAFSSSLIDANFASLANYWSAYAVSLQPTSVIPDPAALGAAYSNGPGRIELTATNVMDLRNTQVTGANYVLINSTNHFLGSSNSFVNPFVSDIYLGSTNGQLAMTNLFYPTVPALNGLIGMWSSIWTNTATPPGGSNAITTYYMVTMIGSDISPSTNAFINNLSLRATNVSISDPLLIGSSWLINGQNLTIASNGPAAVSPFGKINSPVGNWGQNTPTLQNLTNFGDILLANTAFFEGIRQPPYYPSFFDEPYTTMVNHGSISAPGNTIWSSYFENSGTPSSLATIQSSPGSVTIQSSNAVMTNSALFGPSAITITSSNLTIGSTELTTSGALTLSVTNGLTDGDVTGNTFQASGFDLLVAPQAGSGLLGTTVFNSAPAGVQVMNTWAARDMGAWWTGYESNAAIGHLILDGAGPTSVFVFNGAGAQNAIYVDFLDLEDYATNRDSSIQHFSLQGVNINPNMTIYFADAKANGLEISEKLNGAYGNAGTGGGRFVWVPSFHGIFSTTNITYPSGRTYSFNIALVESTHIDSNDNGTANAFDPYPIFTSENLNLTVQVTGKPPTASLISWQSLPGSTNIVYASTSVIGPFSTITNFVNSAPAAGPVSVSIPTGTNSARFFKIEVDALQP